MKCYCANCGVAMDVPESEPNKEPVCCSEECEGEFAEDNPPPWIPDQHYRSQYDYACGYHE